MALVGFCSAAQFHADLDQHGPMKIDKNAFPKVLTTIQLYYQKLKSFCTPDVEEKMDL